MSDNLIRFARKETRQLAHEAEEAGFVFHETNNHGGYVYRYPPTDETIVLWGTPSHGQIARIRRDIRRITGESRGRFDPQARRNRAARDRAKTKRQQIAAEQQRQTIIATKRRLQEKRQAERQVSARYRELRAVQDLMGARGSIF